mgnify:CR=1 FL=1
MAILNAQQIKEINEVISGIEKSINPTCEIGAHDKLALTALLKTQDLKKEVVFFTCKREYSDAIVTYFVKEKNVTKSRFHRNKQAHVFILK